MTNQHDPHSDPWLEAAFRLMSYQTMKETAKALEQRRAQAHIDGPEVEEYLERRLAILRRLIREQECLF